MINTTLGIMRGSRYFHRGGNNSVFHWEGFQCLFSLFYSIQYLNFPVRPRSPWPAPPPPPPSTFCINNVKYQPSAPSYPPPHPHKKNKTPKSKTTTYQINIDAIQGQRLMKHFLNIYLYLIDKETTRSNLEWMITMITSQTSI